MFVVKIAHINEKNHPIWHSIPTLGHCVYYQKKTIKSFRVSWIDTNLLDIVLKEYVTQVRRTLIPAYIELPL